MPKSQATAVTATAPDTKSQTSTPAPKPTPAPAPKTKAVKSRPVAKPAEAKVKPAAQPKTAKTKAAPVAKPAKPVKQKLVRDSFTFPETEYQTLVALKKRLLASGTDVKKGELMRAGLALLSGLDDAALATAVARVEKLKTGRPAK